MRSTDPASPRPRICLARPSRQYSETFIDNHERFLPAEVVTLWSGFFPLRRADDRWILPAPQRYLIRLLDRSPARRPQADRLRTAAVRRFLRRERIEAVLAEYGPTAVHLVSACRQANVPLVAHFHGFDAQAYDVLKEFAAGYRELFAHAAAVVVVSREMAAYLEEMGCPRDKLHIVACGVDTTRFTPTDPGANPPVFLTVGRFVEKKAPHLALCAFARARAQVPEARLIMVGDGQLFDACKQLVIALKLEGSVELLGARDQTQVAECLKRARAFVQHSVRAPGGDGEGTPVAVLEAMASGLPVISTRHAGMPDAVADGVSGFIVPPHDIDEMATRMVTVALDPALARRLGESARRAAEANHALPLAIDRLWRVIDRVRDKASRAP